MKLTLSIFLCGQLMNKYLGGSFYVPGTLLGFGDTKVNQLAEFLLSRSVHLAEGNRQLTCKQNKKDHLR